MEFRKRKARYFLAVSLRCAIAIILPIIFPYNKYSVDHIVGYEWYIIIGVFYAISVLIIAISNSKMLYIIENDKVIIKNSNYEYTVDIKEIEYIKCMFSRGNRKAYEIVLPSHSPNTIYINVNLLNEEGQSLVTVLHAKYRVKLTNF